MLKKFFLTILSVAAISFMATAQDPSEGPPFDPLDPNPAGLPVDGGASILLASGVAFGVKKLRKRQADKKKK